MVSAAWFGRRIRLRLNGASTSRSVVFVIPDTMHSRSSTSPCRVPFAAEAVNDILVNLDPETGPRGWVDPSIYVVERRGDQVMLHRIPQGLELEELARGRVE